MVALTARRSVLRNLAARSATESKYCTCGKTSAVWVQQSTMGSVGVVSRSTAGGDVCRHAGASRSTYGVTALRRPERWVRGGRGVGEGWARVVLGGGRQRTRVAERQPVGERRAVVARVRIGREGLAQRRRCIPPVDTLRHDRGACSRWVRGVRGLRGCCVHGTRTARGTRALSGGSMVRHRANHRLE